MIEQLTLFEDGKGMIERCFICASPVLKKGDTIIERFEVTHKTYDSFSIGDWIEFEH